MRKLIAVIFALVLALGMIGAHAEEPASALVGGWTVPESSEITPELETLLFTALDSYQTGTITISYIPVACLGTQVVAGTNYAILCRASEINAGTTWVIIYVYENLQGETSVLSIADVALGI